jgi:diguanylate cyclase (GGDEF)-like protein
MTRTSEVAIVAPDVVAGGGLVDFTDACRLVLRFLRERTGMSLWMVTRVSGNEWTMLTVEDDDETYGVRAGDVLTWSESFCWHMVRDRAPRVAPRSDDVPAYRDAPVGRRLPISAYVGAPLVGPDSNLFGTLCAIDPAEQPVELMDEGPLVDVLATLLGRILGLELEREAAARRAERAEVDAVHDELTRLANRRGWEQVMAAEETRCARYGDPAGIVTIDLDGLKTINDDHGHAAGDTLLRRAAFALRDSVRAQDLVARVGGDEFAVLALGADAAGVRALEGRIREGLRAADVPASVGSAVRRPDQGLAAAWAAADAAMYADKGARKAAARGAGAPGAGVR